MKIRNGAKTMAVLAAFAIGIVWLAGCNSFESLTGTVTAIDNDGRTIDVEDAKGKTMEIRISKESRIFVDGKNAKFSGLKKGAKVTVKFIREGKKLSAKTVKATSKKKR